MATNPPGKGYISQLPSAGSIGAADFMIIDQGTPPTTRKATLSALYGLKENRQTGTAYTLSPGDLLIPTIILMNNAGAMALTIPTAAALQAANGGVAVPTGVNVMIQRYGAGSLTITAAGGVTLRFSSSATLKNQYSLGFLLSLSVANEWTLGGDQT